MPYELVDQGSAQAEEYRTLRTSALRQHIARFVGRIACSGGGASDRLRPHLMFSFRVAIDAVVAATALELERPVVLLTSDPDDLSRLVEVPERPKAQPIAVIHL